MTQQPFVNSADLRAIAVPAFWPMATAVAMIEQGLDLYARNLEFIAEEIKLRGLRPALATPNRFRLDLRTMVLREYGRAGGIPTLVDAPYAGHTAMIADYQRGQSLIETLLANGLQHVLLTDWKSATADMKDLEIDNYPGGTGRRDRRSRRVRQSDRPLPGRLDGRDDGGAFPQ